MEPDTLDEPDAELVKWREEARRLAECVKDQAQAIAVQSAKRTRLFAERDRLKAQLERFLGEIEPPALTGEDLRRWELAGRLARQRTRVQASALDWRIQSVAAGPPEGRLAASWPPLDPPLAGERHGSWSPLLLAETGSAGSSFWRFPDPRILVRPLAEVDPSQVDVLVFSRATRSDFLESVGELPDALWRRPNGRRLKVVFYAAPEGFVHIRERSDRLQSFLTEKGVNAADAVYITQDRGYRRDYEAYCAKISVQPMQVWVYDHHFGRTLEPFRTDGLAVFERRLAAFLSRPGRRARRFVSLNRTPRPAKLVFLSRLLRDGLWDQGWVSFGGFGAANRQSFRPHNAMAEMATAMPDFLDEAPEVIGRLREIESRGGGLFGVDTAQSSKIVARQPLSADDLPEYGDAWFTVVTETEMSDRLHRITEKPLKPLLSLHPFLILGNPGSLELLRGYGFQTFADVFDERYDEEPDCRRRFDMVYEQFLRLCRAEEDELERMTDALSETIIFNACWGLTELPRLFHERMGAQLVDGLLALGGR